MTPVQDIDVTARFATYDQLVQRDRRQMAREACALRFAAIVTGLMLATLIVWASATGIAAFTVPQVL